MSLWLHSFGGEARLFGGEASPPPPPLDETLHSDIDAQPRPMQGQLALGSDYKLSYKHLFDC